MSVNRCPECAILYLDDEIERGACPSCDAPLGPPPVPPQPDGPTPTRADAVAPRRTAPFFIGLCLGCLSGPVALWAAWLSGAPLPGGWVRRTAAFQAERASKTAADEHARESEATRQAAESALAEALKARDAANRHAAAVSKQQGDAEQQLRDALARLAAEQGRRAALEKRLAEESKPKSAPTLSFVRDWQLLGPFASTGEGAHDAVYPPEREPVRLQKVYDGFGGPIRWRPYHGAEDKIDLAAFFHYREAGAAYAVTWAHSDADQAVTLGVGSDDGVRLRVNGEEVHDVKGGRQARPGQDAVKARLKKGWNEIRAKVDNITGTWELYLEFRTPDGTGPLKIFSTNSPPR